MERFYICLLLLAACSTVSWCQQQGSIEDVLKLCRDRTKVTDDEMKKFMTNGMKEADATPAVKCQIACLMEQQGDLKGGVFNAESVAGALKSMPAFRSRSADIDSVVNKCKTEQGANDCETAFKITMCLKDQKWN